ncbi:MAG: hypothetical protein IPM95_06345 [Sphingobacteriales bacterium]|nr:hypothetical protein [Sphingobacteriales bacterium]
MDSILRKIAVATTSCKQIVLSNRLQLQLTLNKMTDAETAQKQILN